MSSKVINMAGVVLTDQEEIGDCLVFVQECFDSRASTHSLQLLSLIMRAKLLTMIKISLWNDLTSDCVKVIFS